MLKQLQHRPGQPQPQQRSAAAQQQALQQLLLHNLPSARPQRPAHGHLALPSGSPRQHQAGHIHAGNQPQQSRSAQQRHQRRPRPRRQFHIGIKLHHRRSDLLPVVRVVSLRYLRLDHLQLCVRLRRRPPRPQPGNGLVARGSVMLMRIIALSQHRRPPHQRQLRTRSSRRKLKPPRHHSQHRQPNPTQLHSPADNARIRAEPIPPSRITQHHTVHIRRTDGPASIPRRKPAPHRRIHPQHREQVPAYRSLAHMRRPAIALEKRHPLLVHVIERDRLDRPRPLPPLIDIQVRSAIHHLTPPPSLTYRHQLPGISIRQRSQQYMLHHGEHRASRPDPHRERRHHGQREPRRPPQHSQRVPQALKKRLQPPPAPLIMRPVTRQVHIAKLAPRRRLRILLPLTSGYPVRHIHSNVRTHLFLQLVLAGFKPAPLKHAPMERIPPHASPASTCACSPSKPPSSPPFRMFPITATICSQRPRSAASRFFPAAVIL